MNCLAPDPAVLQLAGIYKDPVDIAIMVGCVFWCLLFSFATARWGIFAPQIGFRYKSAGHRIIMSFFVLVWLAQISMQLATIDAATAEISSISEAIDAVMQRKIATRWAKALFWLHCLQWTHIGLMLLTSPVVMQAIRRVIEEKNRGARIAAL